MDRIRVVSSNLASVGYDGRTLEVQFRSGFIYQYSGVPDEVHEALMAASSHGRFFSANIQNYYSYRRIR